MEKDNKVKISVQLEPEQLRELTGIAKKSEISVQNHIRRAITKYLSDSTIKSLFIS